MIALSGTDDTVNLKADTYSYWVKSKGTKIRLSMGASLLDDSRLAGQSCSYLNDDINETGQGWRLARGGKKHR